MILLILLWVSVVFLQIFCVVRRNHIVGFLVKNYPSIAAKVGNPLKYGLGFSFIFTLDSSAYKNEISYVHGKYIRRTASLYLFAIFLAAFSAILCVFVLNK